MEPQPMRRHPTESKPTPTSAEGVRARIRLRPGRASSVVPGFGQRLQKSALQGLRERREMSELMLAR